jgi:hypothetical protein
MADTNLSKVVVPEVFTPYTADMALKTNQLILSGAVAPSEFLNTFIAGGGTTINVPSWAALDSGTPEYDNQTDDSTDVAIAVALDSNRQRAVRLAGAKTWNQMNLAAALAGSNPLDSVALRVAGFINSARQTSLVNQLNGLFSTALSASETDIGAEAVAGQTALTTFNKDTFIGATAPFGDFLADGAIIVCHSDVYRKMQAESAVTTEFIPVGESSIAITRYLGHPVIVDDTVGKVAGTTDGFKYNTYIMRPGAIMLGAGNMETVLHSEPLQGNGAGADYFILRDNYTFHVGGTDFTSATVAGATPTNAELATANNWGKVLDTKQIPVVRLISN